MQVPYHFHRKQTPYGSIKIYHDDHLRFVLTEDAFTLAQKYADVHGWTEANKRTIGGTYPF